MFNTNKTSTKMLDSDMFRSSPDHLQGVYNKQEMLHVRVPEDE